MKVLISVKAYDGTEISVRKTSRGIDVYFRTKEMKKFEIGYGGYKSLDEAVWGIYHLADLHNKTHQKEQGE